MRTDQTDMLAVACGLRAIGAHRGARQIIFNAHMIAQREAAQAPDLPQRPFGRRVVAQPKPAAANDEHPITSDQPAPSVP